jgi:hypothetical protein
MYKSQKDKADSELMMFIQSGNSIQRFTQASFTFTISKEDNTSGYRCRGS